MRVVNEPQDMAAAVAQAQRESQAAFGSSDVFLEKYIQRPRHIEVQLMGDKHGNLVHLYERDCSVQRRYQKVVEIAPAVSLDPALRAQICQSALAIGNEVYYENAGTVEFLVDADTGKYYFIEVNPRIQVEHTVTETSPASTSSNAKSWWPKGASFPTRKLASVRRRRCAPTALRCSAA